MVHQFSAKSEMGRFELANLRALLACAEIARFADSIRESAKEKRSITLTGNFALCLAARLERLLDDITEIVGSPIVGIELLAPDPNPCWVRGPGYDSAFGENEKSG
jgi:hypothetical protein